MSTEMSEELKQDMINNKEALLISKDNYAYDCTFKVGINERTFTALKALLAHLSPVFKGQLFGQFKEASQGRDEAISLLQCDADAFECILRASYGLNPNIKESNVMALFEQSKYYRIPMLEKECTKWLENNLNAQNVLTILNTGYLLGLIDITKENRDRLTMSNTQDNKDSSDSDSDVKDGNEVKTDDENDSDSDSDNKNDNDVVVTVQDNSQMEMTKASTSMNISTNAILKIKNNNEIHDLSSLHIKCLSIICANPDIVLKNDYFWQELHINVIIYIISNDYFNVNEEKLWDVLSKWAQEQYQKTFTKAMKDNMHNDSDEKGGIDVAIKKERKNVLEPPISQIPTTYQVAQSFSNVKYNQSIMYSHTQSNVNNKDNNNTNNNSNSKCLYCEKMNCKLAGSMPLLLMQPLIQHIHFTLMSAKYFANNVENWLLRDDLVFIYKRLCCKEFVDKENDWVNHDARISFDPNSTVLATYQKQSLKTFFDKGYQYKLVEASCELKKAKYLCYEESKKPVEIWSNVPMKECNDQWFIIKLKISNTVIKHICSIGENTTLQFQWKNKEASENTPKNVQFFNCQCDSSTMDVKVEKLSDSDWQLITEWQSQQTGDVQTFNVNVNQLNSPFIKIKIVDLYGGEDNFPLVQDLKILPNW